MCRRLSLLSALVSWCCAHGSLQAQDVAGRYRFVLCPNAPCTIADSAGAAATGYLMLFAESGLLTRLPAAQRARLERRSMFFFFPGNVASANACFSLRRQLPRVADVEVYAGIITNGVTSWRRVDGVLSVSIYRSPDAGFAVVGGIADGVYSGHGVHHDCCGKGTRTIMQFVAQRVGDAHVDDCIAS